MAERVLVVDDDEEFAELLGILLTKNGYQTEVAFTAAQALEAAGRFSPAVIVQDYMLPDMKGIELLRKLKDTQPSPSVIIITARGSEDIAVEIIKSGASDYVKKPFESEKLLSTVENTLRLRTSESERLKLASEVNQQHQLLLALNALSAALTSSMGRDEMCGSTTSIILKNMRADMVNVFTAGASGKKFALKASHCVEGEDMKGCRLDQVTGIANYVAETRKAVVVPDFAREQRFKAHEEALGRGLTSALAVPMMARDKLRGVLAVYTKGPRPFPSFDIKLLTSFANILALALESETLHEELRRGAAGWKGALDAIPERVTVVDTGHRIVMANEAAALAAGQRPEEMVGQQCCWLFHNKREPILGCPVDDVLATGKAVHKSLELGGEVYDVWANPVLDSDGKVEMVAEYVRKAR